jgi:hypothetical protein
MGEAAGVETIALHSLAARLDLPTLVHLQISLKLTETYILVFASFTPEVSALIAARRKVI